MRRFVTDICGVKCGSRENSGPKFDVFARQILGRPPKISGTFVNRNNFRLMSVIYADEIKTK